MKNILSPNEILDLLIDVSQPTCSLEYVISKISTLLKIDYVLVSVPIPAEKNSPVVMRTVQISNLGKTVSNFSYPLSGTPCEAAVKGNICIFPSNIQSLFPDDILLQDMNLHFYAGMPLLDAHGQLLGVFAFLGSKSVPRASLEYFKNCLNIFCNKVRFELERTSLELKLDSAKSRYEELGKILEYSADEIYVFDQSNYNLTYVNNAAEENLGYSLDEFRKMTPYDFKLAANQKTFLDLTVALRSGEAKAVHFQTEMKRKNQSHYVAEVYVYKCVFNKTQSYCAVVDDVTEKIKMELELREAEKVTRHQAKLVEIGELASGVGHEINNPLAILLGNVFRLRKEVKKHEIDQTEFDKVIGKLESAIERIKNIVDGLRTYSRIDTDDNTDFDIHELIKSCTSLVREIYASNGVQIENHFEAKNSKIHGNFGKCQQILMNLLSNARDALELKPEGERLIVISTENQNGSVKISVKDSGCGMTDTVKERLFNPFFTTKPIGKGTGIGMGVVLKIVKEHQGQVSVVSKVSEGTCVSFLFPVIDFSKQIFKASVQPPARAANHIEHQELLHGQALIIEDEDEIRSLLCEVLQSFNLKVDQAIDGQDGLLKVNAKQYDYIISDMKMPRMNGLNFIRQAKKLPLGSSSKYILITGGVNNESNVDFINELKKLNVDFISKPYDLKVIYNSLVAARKTDKAAS